MDGWEFLYRFKRLKPKLEDTIVAMLTTSAKPEDREKAFKHESVVNYLEKPLTEEKLHQLLHEHFRFQYMTVLSK
ncbi:hypothetical protein A4R26_32510 [Niastella populi]|uniref:Response regulatory domain-containing protein n=2 Tax=Niastella populi TaxID=550983 RepID=A0A1V9EFL7_9BACT|nr:hypothetical protein A4R26_32510 [Niastella populi]